ncbi:golgi reassembly stacking protein grasp like protein [Babesia gibsoni]|uniref:Golgi reassembly stacking protein grasp like protein n=1 Tax=Babesia gibsoni TaxID=33632 RepID=A0AAD8LNE0_BABGI|nr:golgi reassembly stacking protein grasp like protein [Babesia gibsoni]
MGASSSKVIQPGGLRVYRVYPNGPGEEAGFEVFFDYILEANHNGYCDDSEATLTSFTSYIASQENQEVTLNVYNARKKSLRLVKMKPRKWEGTGLLGLSVRYAELTAMDEGAHVINVHEGSPASKAGIMPITDYLLGTNLQLFMDSDCVRLHVGERVNEDVTLYVYNSITETIRKTVITPKDDWGGPGTLGCDLANGYIHRIPYIKSIFGTPQEHRTTEKLSDPREEETLDLSAAAATTSHARPERKDHHDSDRETNESHSVISLQEENPSTEDEEGAEESYLPPSIVTLQRSSSMMENDHDDSQSSSDANNMDF